MVPPVGCLMMTSTRGGENVNHQCIPEQCTAVEVVEGCRLVELAIVMLLGCAQGDAAA